MIKDRHVKETMHPGRARMEGRGRKSSGRETFGSLQHVETFARDGREEATEVCPPHVAKDRGTVSQRCLMRGFPCRAASPFASADHFVVVVSHIGRSR